MKLQDFKNAAFQRTGTILSILFFGMLCFIPSFLHSQEIGYKYFINYSNKDYDHLPQNWGIVQAENGLIYVANHGGVLEYDGASWRIIGIPDYATVRSLTVDATGTVYAGGIGEFGYLAPDEKGTLIYNSLCGSLPENQKKFAEVWKTYTVGKYVYFDAPPFLFLWEPEQKKLIGLPRLYNTLLKCGEELFIRSDETGLEKIVKVDNNGLQTVPIIGGEKFKTIKISMITPYPDGSLLVGTRNNGLYIYDGKTVAPFQTEVDDYLNKNDLYNGIQLSAGDFALSTLRGGLVVIDIHGHLKHIFDKTSGLLDDQVYSVFEDSHGNLWMCLSIGISKIEYDSPISIYDDRVGLTGLVFSVVRHHDNLYVGTSTGLYYFESSSLKLRPVPGISTECWSLLSIEDSLLVATKNGVFLIDSKSDTNKRIIDESSYVLFPSKHDPGRVWCGTRSGLAAFSFEDGLWKKEPRFKNGDPGIRTIAEDKKGNVWLGTLTGDVVKIDSPINIDSPSISRYDRSFGLPDGDIFIAGAAGHIVFATQKGLFRFDEKAGAKDKTFTADSTLGGEFAGGPNSKPVFRIVEDNKKNIWFHSESRNYQAVPGADGTYTINAAPFRRIPDTFQVNTIYPEPDGRTIWFGSQGGGLVRFDTTVKKNYLQDFQTMVRRVVVNKKSIFEGYRSETGTAGEKHIPTFKYEERNLRFEFAAPFFEAETVTQYRCFLESYDENWTQWDKESKKDFPNLDAGLYTFRVQAKNIYEHTGREDAFQFKILLPWYRTWWAFLSYGVVLFIFSYLTVKWWRSIQLEKEKEKLEQIVEERTKEIKEKNQQLEKQTDTLKEQSEKLQEMDKIKSRFFANISHEFRTPLALIMGPIEQMLSENRDKSQRKTLNVMLKSSQEVLTRINQLLDLSRFDSGKMKLKAAYQNIVPFLKGICSSFHNLAIQNQLELEFRSGEEENISIYFDSPKMEEVIVNLLINAVKFTPSGGRISVSLSRDESERPGFVKISVRDTGIGISKEQFGYIFDRFHQAENIPERGRKGTGIGLALVKEIVDMHHGKIDVHSSEGMGSEFVIKLLLGAEHLKPDEIAVSSDIEPNHPKYKDIEALYSQIEEEDETDEEDEKKEDTGNNEKNVILVVEDHADVRKYIRRSLEPIYTVVEARDGKDGIKKAKEIIPDLIVSDIVMPEVDGYALCRELKKDIKTSHIPIILLTAKASDENVIEGLETGADDYITKPFNTKMLGIRIKNLIDLRWQMQLKIQRRKTLLPSEISVSSMDDKFLDEFQGIIKKNIKNPNFDIGSICEKLYMGRSTLFRKIQALTGETPNQFILSYRLELATQLLKKKFGNITEVAFEVGFSSTAYFSKCFKEKFHQSPSSFLASEGPGSIKEQGDKQN